ncbi:MAG: MFS transporter [Spirochaetaceae bacterium]|nr:MFS transporter [Spirochaetaceae bacterium]
MTCVAIFFTSEIIIRKGWKPSFIAGLIVMALGTLLSATAQSIPAFIIARYVNGFGYGVAWMTLRNLCLLVRDEEEQSRGFVLLNSGGWAGINCAAVLGSILAESIGYRNVFFISALITVLCVLSVLNLKNASIRRTANPGTQPERKEAGKRNRAEVMEAVGFLLLLALPPASSWLTAITLSRYMR